MIILEDASLEVTSLKGNTMTLTLNDIEVLEYMDMKQRIVDLNTYIEDLKKMLSVSNEYTASLESQQNLIETDIAITGMAAEEEPIVPETSDTEKPLGHWTRADWIAYVGAKELPVNRKGSAWVKGEDNIIQIAVDQTHPAFKISNIAKFLGRSVGAINSRAIQSGYSIKKNFIIKN